MRAWKMLAAFFIASQDKRNDKEKMLAVSKNRTIRPEELEVVVVAAISLLWLKSSPWNALWSALILDINLFQSFNVAYCYLWLKLNTEEIVIVIYSPCFILDNLFRSGSSTFWSVSFYQQLHNSSSFYHFLWLLTTVGWLNLSCIAQGNSLATIPAQKR